MSKTKHILRLLLAGLLWLSLTPALMAQEEEDVLVPDSTEIVKEVRKPDSIIVDTASLFAITENILAKKRHKRDLATFKPDPIRSM